MRPPTTSASSASPNPRRRQPPLSPTSSPNKLLQPPPPQSSSADLFDLVRSILREMESSKIAGNISTVNLVVGIFGATEDLLTCIDLVKKWKLNMNAYTYKCLLQALLRSRDSTKAFDNYMERRGYKLDVFAYCMLLDALAKDENV